MRAKVYCQHKYQNMYMLNFVLTPTNNYTSSIYNINMYSIDKGTFMVKKKNVFKTQ